MLRIVSQVPALQFMIDFASFENCSRERSSESWVQPSLVPPAASCFIRGEASICASKNVPAFRLTVNCSHEFMVANNK